MYGIQLGEIIQWTDAELVGMLDRSISPLGVSTDSRSLAAGELFIALRGEHFDGHAYVEAAFKRGACAAIVERGYYEALAEGTGPLLVVESPLAALGKIAAQYRARFDIPVIGITGSAGKTTTKEMVAAVLSQRYNVLKTVGSENNEIGVPRTLLQLSSQHEVVVLELAARQEGDIRYLCSIAQPTMGVLLNIGTAHLEFFGSVEGVAKAKGELLEYLDESLTALINADDRVVCREVQRTKGRLRTFGFRCESKFRGEGLILDQEGCGHFLLHNYSIDLQIPGKHNAYNALAAAAVGEELGVTPSQIQQALFSFRPVYRRSEVTRTNDIIIINDSYNANPSSMAAALDLLAAMATNGGRKVALLGDMLELGKQSSQLHADVGRRAAEVVDILLAVGPQSQHMVEAARAVGLTRARHFTDREEVVSHLSSELRANDVFLVKASQGMELWEVIEQLGR